MNFYGLKNQIANFVNMLSTKKLLLRLFFAAIITVPTINALSQAGQILDTSDYLPVYYEGALDNNLMVAASRGYDGEIVRLIDKGADINAETYEGATALIFAVANNQLTTVLTLLEYGPYLDKLTSNNETPLIISIRNKNTQIAEVLLRAGADINLPDKNGATPLQYAVLEGSFDITDLLIYYDADCNKKANDGTSPLMAAIWAGFSDISDLLIQNGANLEARDNDGFTPFLIAAQKGDTLIMDLLFKEGVDIYERNNYNYNALAIAIESNQKNAVEFLLEKGDKWSSSENSLVNPYRIASSYGRKDIIELLEKKNITGKQGLGIDEISLVVSGKFNLRDYYTGFSLAFREPLLGAGFFAGTDIKPGYTRVLLKEGENTYYQYFDKSSVVYGGIFKDFTINEYPKGYKLSFITSLSIGYSFANKFKGTGTAPENRVRLMPAAGIKFQKSAFTFNAGIEYMKSDFYRIGPLWINLGVAYSYFASRVKAPSKTIKWY